MRNSVCLGGSAAELVDFIGKGLGIENVDQFGNLFDFSGADVGVDEFLDFSFVFLEIDDLGIASTHSGIELHEKF